MPPKAPNQAEQPPAGPSSRRFQFHKRSQLFMRMYNVTLSVVAVRISNPDRSSVGINC
jgi:hypothetical protein